MPLTRPRLRSIDFVTTVPETSQRSAQEHTIRSSTPSAISTTTFTDAATIVAGVEGLISIPEDGDARGLPRMIKSQAANVATVDAAWPSVTGVTRIRLWKLAELPVRVTTAGTTVISTEHSALSAEPDGYWANGDYQLYCVSGVNAGKAYLITAFTAASGTFTVSPVPTTTSVGDVFLIRQVVKMESDTNITFNEKVIERKVLGVGDVSADVPVPITSDGTFSVEMAAKTLVTPGGSGVQASKPLNLHSLLCDVFNSYSDTGGTVSAAGVSTVTLASSVLTQGGGLLLATGEVVQVGTTNGVNVTAYPAGQLNYTAVAAGSIGNASTWYAPKTTNFITRAWDVFLGGMDRVYLSGCTPKVTMSIQRDNFVRFKFEYTMAEGFRYTLDRIVPLGATAPVTLPDTTIPRDSKGSIIVLDGVKYNVSDISVTFDFAPLVRPSLGGMNQADGTALINMGGHKISFKVMTDDNDKVGGVPFASRIPRRKNVSFKFQQGSAKGETFWLGTPTAYFTKIAEDGGSGQYMYNCEMALVKPETVLGSTYANHPPISFGWC